MFANPAASWNMNAQKTCEHCGRISRHEKWCITCDPLLQYAYRVVTDPGKLTLRDRLILHALGVTWGNAPYEGEFQQRAEVREARV
jgi:hypothetical protein